ncbi:MAG: glucokinase [Asticcacaulis sp.]
MNIARDEIRALLDVRRVNIVNNFVARALAIPRLRHDEVQKICGEATTEEQGHRRAWSARGPGPGGFGARTAPAAGRPFRAKAATPTCR